MTDKRKHVEFSPCCGHAVATHKLARGCAGAKCHCTKTLRSAQKLAHSAWHDTTRAGCEFCRTNARYGDGW